MLKTKRSKKGLAALLALHMALLAVPFSVNAAEPAATPMISAGGYHTAALKSDGTIWAWGANNSGQLGDDTRTNSSTPVEMDSLTGVTAVSTGDFHTAALKSDGTVWTWGKNGSGQLGNGTTTSSSSPVQVADLTDVTAISAGDFHTVALKSDGTVWVWGLNNYGQLGNGTTTDSSTPVQAADLTDVTAISVGISTASSSTAALKSDGTVWVWGENGYGQLGAGITGLISKPMQVPDLAGVTAISVGQFHTVVLKEDGTVWAWGLNNYGQLGNGTKTDSTSPVQVDGLAGVTAISVGQAHSAALKEDGTVWTWGRNQFGQLGNGKTGEALVPVQTLEENGGGFLNLKTTVHTTTATITASTTIPSPTYTVTIPAAIPVGDISKTDNSTIKSTTFDVVAANVANLGKRRVDISIYTLDGAFNLTDGNNHFLPYKIFAQAADGVAIASGEQFTSFTADGTVTGRVDVDRTDIPAEGSYTGTVTFTIALVDAVS